MSKLRGLSGMLAAAALAGCASTVPTTAIKVADSSATLPTLRASVRLERSDRPQAGLRDEQALEFIAATGKGSDTQSLSAGQPPVVVGDTVTTFNAPQSLRHEYEFTYLDFSWRGRLQFGPTAGRLELLAGLSYLETELRVASATQSALEKRSAAGLSLGVGGIWDVRPSTSLQVRAVFIAPLGEFDEITRIEGYVVQALGRNLAARAGYAAWRIRVDSSNTSAVKVNLSGPSLGLDLSF